jgi:hypothetical protein
LSGAPDSRGCFETFRDFPSCPSNGISLHIKLDTPHICVEDGLSDLCLQRHKSAEKSCDKRV